MLELPEWALGGAGGAALVGGIKALLQAFGRRVEASAAQDEAAAYGFRALADQVKALTTRCDTLEAEVLTLRAQNERQEEQLEAERAERQHWQQKFHEAFAELTATKQAAMKLRAEWEADKARPSVKSERPGPGSQRKV